MIEINIIEFNKERLKRLNENWTDHVNKAFKHITSRSFSSGEMDQFLPSDVWRYLIYRQNWPCLASPFDQSKSDWVLEWQGQYVWRLPAHIKIFVIAFTLDWMVDTVECRHSFKAQSHVMYAAWWLCEWGRSQRTVYNVMCIPGSPYSLHWCLCM